MDRIELGTQSLAEFRGFADYADDVQGTDSTIDLIGKLKSDISTSQKLIVTSIQKMSNINDKEVGPVDLKKIRQKRLIIIVDEAHRSTFGEMLLIIKQTFPDAIFFGFTGTPIHEENKRKDSTTATIFGNELHRYSLYDGIRDKNVLGFDVSQVETLDYRDLRQEIALNQAAASTPEEAFDNPEKVKVYEHFLDSKKVPLSGYENEESGNYVKGLEDYLSGTQFNNDKHRKKVVEDIYKNWTNISKNGKYSAIFTTSSIKEAIKYYRLIKNNPLDLKVTALFDKNLDESEYSKEKEDGLADIIKDYNRMYDKEFIISNHDYFKKDISSRLAHKGVYKYLEKKDQIDIVIVVEQLLTGYDSKWVNTLYLDKTMEYANIIQAFSRTNRLNGNDKPFGTIRYYRKVHTMERNIKKAVKLYSGDREFGLFVDKLGGNLKDMNRVTEDISSVFSVDGIELFEKLPKSVEARKKFIKLFKEFEGHLEAALIQGFVWGKETYKAEIQAGQDKERITVIFTKEIYQSWLLRYKELADINDGNGSSEPGNISYDIDYTIVQKDTGRIDYDYLNSNFDRYVNLQKAGDPEERKRVKNDLHRFFATLTSDQQIYGSMVINDLENGSLIVTGGKTFMDYINDYKERTEDINIKNLTDAFGLDEEKLRSMINLNIDKNNINEFGRFSKLKDTVDKSKARTYLEDTFEINLKPYEVNLTVDNLLRDFVFEGGFEVEEYLSHFKKNNRDD